MKYKIIGTGSTGNCVVIDGDLMFDIGLPFKRIHDALFGVKYIVITHIHTDHLNVATAKHIRRLFPNIKFIGNEQVNEKFPVDIIAEADQPIELDGFTLVPFYAPHNVLVYGYTWRRDGKNYLYVTDTESMRNAPTKQDNGGYDYLFLEANHDQRIIEQILADGGDKKFGYDVVDGSMRHLSTQQAKAFYYLNRRDSNSVWIRLHQSGRFY
ncbi:MBL fold metallo-hydrolase [Levilactobacillus cerevisiae]|mgnify:CR=1 FL=1|uniref:MBL fold metallo-hydrolase n=1 Tax=Levilactobacillus cerevisiae TaxID=1704076 RepID=UPI00345E15CD